MGQPGQDGGAHLLQSEKTGWPNDVENKVVAPGVPSIVLQPDGSYRLYFDGFDPANLTANIQTGMFNGKIRQPYMARLLVNVPVSATVAGATDAELATWIVPDTQ